MKKSIFLLPLVFVSIVCGNAEQKLNPQEIVCKYCVESTVDHIFFAPEDGAIYKGLIRGLIQMAGPESKIYVAAFRFTDKDICNDLIIAHQRGVAIEAVFDPGAVTAAFYSGVFSLCEAGIPVYQYIPVSLKPAALRTRTFSKGAYPTIMHQKTVIFENTFGRRNFVVFGSLNFTTAGFYGNEEAVQVRNSPQVIAAFLEHFELLKKRSYIVSLAKTAEQPTLTGIPYIILNVFRRITKK